MRLSKLSLTDLWSSGGTASMPLFGTLIPGLNHGGSSLCGPFIHSLLGKQSASLLVLEILSFLSVTLSDYLDLCACVCPPHIHVCSTVYHTTDTCLLYYIINVIHFTCHRLYCYGRQYFMTPYGSGWKCNLPASWMHAATGWYWMLAHHCGEWCRVCAAMTPRPFFTVWSLFVSL